MKQHSSTDMMYYFLKEKRILVWVTLSGLIYNGGMALAPWFEGQLAQYVADVLGGNRKAHEVFLLALWYLITIGIVQGARYFKRLYVRKFANHISLTMKSLLYHHLLAEKPATIRQTDQGAFMTRVISDVDACVEGMRKFTTEIFDTGVVMISYTILLLYYDWKLTLLVSLFPPIAYLLAERLKGYVTRCSAAAKVSSSRLSSRTMDRIGQGLTYRLYGEESRQNEIYETYLSDYEKKTVRANLWNAVMGPTYEIIAMTGAIFILYFGSQNVEGAGWTTWDIAAFSAYLACFTRLSIKASHAAKLFNAVQKAKVSWQRIQPYLSAQPLSSPPSQPAQPLIVSHVSVTYPGSAEPIFTNLSFTAQPGTIIGVTGEIASGKSTLGRLFLQEFPYKGNITWGGNTHWQPEGLVGYMGHQTELFSGTIEENIQLGQEGNIFPVLHAVDMEQDISTFPEGIHSPIGEGGLKLSGGQQARIALARLLYHKRPLLILDDPLAALDARTESIVLSRLRALQGDSIILFLSHRLSAFPTFDQVIWMEKGKTPIVSTHETLMETVAEYRRLYTTGTTNTDLQQSVKKR